MDPVYSQFFAQFPVAFAVAFVGYFFVNKMDNYNKSIMEIAINSTKAIENCTQMMNNLESSMREVRETQLIIKNQTDKIK